MHYNYCYICTIIILVFLLYGIRPKEFIFNNKTILLILYPNLEENRTSYYLFYPIINEDK